MCETVECPQDIHYIANQLVVCTIHGRCIYGWIIKLALAVYIVQCTANCTMYSTGTLGAVDL